MKTWMKVLMWVGLGGALGFFTGLTVGRNTKIPDEEDESEEARNWNSYSDGYWDGYEAREEEGAKAKKAISEYEGNSQSYEVVVEEPATDEVPEMPMDEPVIDDLDEDIPEAHPQDFVPKIISENEYYENPWQDDQQRLIFYEMDEVLFNPEDKAKWTSRTAQDRLLGVGTLFGFQKDEDTIYVRNETLGVIFRVDRVDAAYDDIVSGADAPDYVEDDTE